VSTQPLASVLNPGVAHSLPSRLLSATSCDRREQFHVEALKQQHGGEVKMLELLSRLVADCPRQRAFSIYDRCRAVYDERSRYGERPRELRGPFVGREGER
jgi:hypothetical protein